MINNSLPPDLTDSIINTVMIAFGYLVRLLQNILTKKNKKP